MTRRKFTWLLLTAFAVSLHLAGTAHAQYRYWYPYRSWSGDYPFRYKHHPRHKKSDSATRAKSQKAAQDAAKDVSKDAAKGPLLLIISIADQRISLYDDGALIARSAVSTGVKGHPTPVGVFSVISKSKWHRSNIYSGAPMPYMQRITWSGIALHAGDLPGYPASHGCIRLTHDFAVRLWHLTRRGTRVIIAHDDIRPAEISNPQLFVPKPKVALASPQSGTAVQPSTDAVRADATDAPLIANAKQDDAKADAKGPDPASGTAPKKGASISVFVSRKLGKLFVRQGFTPLFDVPVTIQDAAEPMGTHVFTAMDFRNDGTPMRWTVVTVPEKPSHSQRTPPRSHKGRAKETIKTVLPTPSNASAALSRIEMPQDAVERIAQLLTPGSSLIISDHGISGETGAGTDFIVLTR
ncbi:MAG TPA: L,D-transpeptidase [Pseudolabrys sp.]|nr:L,D-transpeptidase [Pseudolabrys sp.]